MAQNEWANIPPKTIKAEWEPMISTEDFERGLAILAQRKQLPMPNKKHFYLLQGIIHLEDPSGLLRKLRCAMPNANRERGGVAYYCVPSCDQNYLCHMIDDQIQHHLQLIQIDPNLMPPIRRAYLEDIDRYVKDHGNERKGLETRLSKLQEKELNLWRGFSEHGMRPQVFETLTRECQEEQASVKLLLVALTTKEEEYIANLDAALQIISEIALRFPQHTVQQQRVILLHMVERVIIDVDGKIKRLELKPPFSYLCQLGHESNEGEANRKTAKRKTSTTAGSLQNPLGAPIGSQRRNRVLPLPAVNKLKMPYCGTSTTAMGN